MREQWIFSYAPSTKKGPNEIDQFAFSISMHIRVFRFGSGAASLTKGATKKLEQYAGAPSKESQVVYR